MSTRPLQLRQLLERLVGAEVRFVLVGGLAVNAWGYLRGTEDIDIVPDPNDDNLARLADVLDDLGGQVVVQGRLTTRSAITIFLSTGDKTLVRTPLGEVDVLQGLPQVPRYSELARTATEVDLDGVPVRVCSLGHLLEMKRAAGRPRDIDDLQALEAAHSPERDEPDQSADVDSG